MKNKLLLMRRIKNGYLNSELWLSKKLSLLSSSSITADTACGRILSLMRSLNLSPIASLSSFSSPSSFLIALKFTNPHIHRTHNK